MDADNISGIVNSTTAAYSSLTLPGSGVSYINGTINLRQNAETFDFDDRFNTKWRRGNRIIYTYTDPDDQSSTSYRYPIIGETYILTSLYDFKSSLTLQTGCILALLNTLTASDLGICIDIAQEAPISTSVINLLLAAGVPTAQLDTTSFNNLLTQPKLVEPLSVPSNQSIIDVAARLAGRHGCFFCQDSNGIVKCYLWNDVARKPRLISKRAKDLHSYKRQGSVTKKIKTFFATYNEAVITEIEDETSTTIEKEGGNSTRVDTVRDNDNRTITTTTREYRTSFTSGDALTGNPLILVSRTIVISNYEPEPSSSANLVKTGQVNSTGECFPEDRARITSRTTEIQIDNSEYVKSWVNSLTTASQTGRSNKPNPNSLSDPVLDNEWLLFNGLQGYKAAQIIEENWDYVSENEINYTLQAKSPIAYAVPIWGDQGYNLASSDPRLAGGDPLAGLDSEEEIVIREIKEKYVKKNPFSDRWELTREETQIAFFDSQENIISALANESNAIVDVYNLSKELVPVNTTFNNNTSPSIETFPPSRDVGANEITIVAGEPLDTPLVSQVFPLDVIRREFLGDYFNYSYSEILKNIKFSMDFSNGRVLGVVMADSPFIIPFDLWEEVVPFFLCKVIEPYENFASIFVADTPSITLTATETVMAWLGSFLGYQTNQSEIDDLGDFSFTKVPNIQPPSDPEAQSIPSINITGSLTVESTLVDP